LDESGDNAGDEGLGELKSAGVEPMTEDRYTLPLKLGADESSTSLSSDCKKLGPVALLSARALPVKVVPLASLPVLEDSPP